MYRFFYLLWIFITCACFSDQTTQTFSSPKNITTFFVSYPRSGRTWFSGVIKTITQMQTQPIENYKPDLEHNILYYVTHHSDDLKGINTKENKFILLLRNYKECIARNKLNNYPRAYKDIMHGGSAITLYINNLKKYDSWHPEKRLLVYYEDLILYPRETFTKVLAFLQQDISLVDKIMKNYEQLKQEMLQKYIKSQKYSASYGNDIYYHSKKYSLSQIKAMDEAIALQYPDLWKKYIYRYGGISYEQNTCASPLL